MYCILYTIYYTTALHDNFPEFACWRVLILSKFQNQFCACSAQLGQKFGLGSLFNTKMPAPLRIGAFVIVRGTDKVYIEGGFFFNNVMGCYLFISDNVHGLERIKKSEER